MSKKIYILFYFLFTVLSLVPKQVWAQGYSFDNLTIEALVDDHKRVRSVLLARSGIETANTLLHQYSKKATVSYDSLNVKLDKYTLCFDVIDVIYNSGIMVMNTRNTYDDVSERIKDMKELLEQFVEMCTLRGDILSSDTILVNACKMAVIQVGKDGKELLKSVIELSEYLTGVRHITTAGLLDVIGEINDCLYNIRNCIDHAYYVVWKYVTLRTHYFKRSLYMAKDLHEMVADAFARWRMVTRAIGYSNTGNSH